LGPLGRLALGATVGVGVGCREKQPPADPDELTVAELLHPRLALPAHSVAVAEGPAPLVFMLNDQVSLRVVDRTSGQVIASGVGRSNEIVSVDVRGVRVGKRLVQPGPLPADHRYAIEIDLSSSATGTKQPEAATTGPALK
jgi:hypothetical protein